MVCTRRFKSALLFFGFVAAVLFLSKDGTAYGQRPSPDEWKWIDDNIAEGCLHKTLHSKANDREIGYSIYLPPSYEAETSRRYPVVYYLHGAGGSESSSREFAWAVQLAIKEGLIPEVIYVFPNGGHFSGYRDWEDGSVKAETWIIDELIPHIDESYRTIPSREGRALCGWSMGGGGSLRFLMKYPEMFCAAATMSAAVQMRGENEEDSVLHHLKANVDKLRDRAGIWMAVGADDRLKSGNESLSKSLKDAGIEHSLKILPDTPHNLGIMSKQFHREIVLMLASHLTKPTDEGISSDGEPEIIRDVAYRSKPDSDYARQRCHLDLYIPGCGEGFPTIVWFHGGGLQNGDKAGEHEVALAQRFVKDGIAVASVNYRLSPKATYPAYIEDAAAAVAYVLNHIEEHGGSRKRVFVSGHSAGGYLTSMVGMDAKYLSAFDCSPNDIAGYLPIAGQMVTHSTVREERGIPSTQPIIDEAAPAYHVTSDRPPFLCVVGSNDLPARAEENRYFVAAMKAAGHKHVTYLEVEGRDHGSIAHRIPEGDDIVANRMLELMHEIMTGAIE